MINLYDIQDFEIIANKEEYFNYKLNNGKFTKGFCKLDNQVTNGAVSFPFCVGLVEDDECSDTKEYRKIEEADLNLAYEEIDDLKNTLEYLIRNIGGVL